MIGGKDLYSFSYTILNITGNGALHVVVVLSSHYGAWRGGGIFAQGVEGIFSADPARFIRYVTVFYLFYILCCSFWRILCVKILGRVPKVIEV